MATPAWALTVGNTSQTEGSANTTVTLAHTVVAGDNRVLLVGIARQDVVGAPNVTGVTYGGVALTAVTNGKASSPPGWDDAEWWYLDSPAVGGANVVVTVSASTQASMGVMARDYSGCGSGGCTITGNYTANGSTGTSLSVASVSLEDGQHALAAVTLAINGRTTSWTNATEDYDDDFSAMSYSFATRNATTTESPTITATFSSNPIRSAMSIIVVAAGDGVTYDAASYALGGTITATATGFASALTTITNQTGSDAITANGGATSSSATFTMCALGEFTATGDCNNTQWNVQNVWQITDGTDTQTDSFEVVSPTNSTSSYFTGSSLCTKGSCPADSLIETIPLTGFTAGDDLYCQATSGTFTTINEYGVPMYPGDVTIGCRYFDESGGVWTNESSKSFTVSSSNACGTFYRVPWKSVNNAINRASDCLPY